MSPAEYTSLLPLLITGGGAILAMLFTAFFRNHAFMNGLTVVLLAASFLSILGANEVTPIHVWTIFEINGFTLFYTGLIIGCSLAVTLLSYGYLEKYPDQKEEYYILILLATFGAGVLVNSQHFISLFLGLEILSVSLYVLIAYLQESEKSLEAGTKYLVMAAASSAFLLFGMALIYNILGTMEFNLIASRLASISELSPLFVAGLAIMIVGIGFKLAIVPFHLWTPDVYQGAPAPVTALVATISKGSMFGVWIHFYMIMEGGQYPSIVLIFSIIAIASMLLGNLLALLQDNVKRILAYSSVAHLGYLLVAFLAAGMAQGNEGPFSGLEASTFYLVAYFITTLGSFGVIAVMSGKYLEGEDIKNYQGLFWRKPFLALIFTAMLLSLAGIPLTAGFIGKYFVVASGIQSELWYLVILLVISSVIGLYYYLRIVATMFRPEPEGVEDYLQPTFNFTNTLALAILGVLVVWYGVYPTGMIDLIHSMIGGVT